ncbi:MAG TPA: hypothetical protein VMH02_10635 [Verrucomicrobiae bacterium]|nr:hypothetical protein [Verrucomicrobiae bacterium]
MKSTTTILALGALLASGACSHQTAASNGEATVATHGTGETQSVTVTNKEGTATLGGTIDPAKLGAPVYPGAQSDAAAHGSLTEQTAGGAMVMATFKTADSFDQVYSYYKSQLPAGSEKLKMSAGGQSTAAFQVGADDAADQIQVQISAAKPGETDILIEHVTRTATANP